MDYAVELGMNPDDPEEVAQAEQYYKMIQEKANTEWQMDLPDDQLVNIGRGVHEAMTNRDMARSSVNADAAMKAGLKTGNPEAGIANATKYGMQAPEYQAIQQKYGLDQYNEVKQKYLDRVAGGKMYDMAQRVGARTMELGGVRGSVASAAAAEENRRKQIEAETTGAFKEERGMAVEDWKNTMTEKQHEVAMKKADIEFQKWDMEEARRKREQDPNSDESKLMRDLFKRMGMPAPESLTAAKGKELLPGVEKLYKIEQDKLDKEAQRKFQQDQLAEQRRHHTASEGIQAADKFGTKAEQDPNSDISKSARAAYERVSGIKLPEGTSAANLRRGGFDFDKAAGASSAATEKQVTALDTKINSIEGGIGALEGTVQRLKRAEELARSVNTGQYLGKVAGVWKSDERQEFDRLSNMAELQAAVAFLKGQGQVSNAERVIAKGTVFNSDQGQAANLAAIKDLREAVEKDIALARKLSTQHEASRSRLRPGAQPAAGTNDPLGIR